MRPSTRASRVPHQQVLSHHVVILQVSAVYNDPDTNRAPQRQRQGHTGSIFAQTPVQPAPAVANGVTQPPVSLPVANPYQIPANMLVMPSMMPDGEPVQATFACAD